jgi:ribulose-phosphate 3-epimerase
MPKHIRQIVPSILTSDFARLLATIKTLEKAGVKMVHLDVMDGHFVPNITFGPVIVSSIRKHTTMLFDVHLMISDPAKYADRFISAGADIITFHIETMKSTRDTTGLINKIRQLNKKAGISVNPKTDIKLLYPYINRLYLALVMTVEPGFGGQGFIRDGLTKISGLRNYITKNKHDCLIEVDGGINEQTCPEAIRAGANLLVAGNAIFGKKDIKKAYTNLTQLCRI